MKALKSLAQLIISYGQLMVIGQILMGFKVITESTVVVVDACANMYTTANIVIKMY